MKHLPVAAAALALIGCQDYVQSAGFDPEVDGFSEPNFGGNVGPARVDSVALMELFGPAACEPGSLLDDGLGCTPTAAAREWMAAVNLSMTGGRCEGFTTLAQAFWQGTESTDAYGSDTAAGLSDVENGPLSRELGRWQATQFLPSVAAQTRLHTVEEALVRLSE